MKKRFCALLLVLAFNWAAPAKAETVRVETTQGSSYLFKVEIAKSHDALAKGLMFRRHLPVNTGMLFIYDKPKPVTFWMKNTFIPLDMIFIREDGTIAKIVEKTKPRSEKHIPCEEPVLWVLEVKGGESAKRAIKAGDKVVLEQKHKHVDQK